MNVHNVSANISAIDRAPQCPFRQYPQNGCGYQQNRQIMLQYCYTVSMDRETWVSLSMDGKSKWDTISIADCAKILCGTRKRGVKLYIQQQTGT